MVIFEKRLRESNFSLGRLDSLLAVHEYGYIRKAVQALGKPNTAAAKMSTQIGQLEDFFGAALTKKEGKLLKLSEQGEELAEIYERFLRALEEFQAMLDEVAPTITIGAGQTHIEKVLIPKLNEIRSSLADAKVSLKNRQSDALVDGLKSGDLDFAIMSEGRLRDNEDLESRRLRSVKYCLFVPKQWVGKVKRNQPCDAIFEIPFASLDGDGELRRLLNEWALRDRGERLNPDLECTSQTQIATAIEHGACCGILPDFFESSFDRKDVTVFRSSKLDDLKRTLHLAWFAGNPRRSLNPIRAKAIQSIAGAFGS